jgi:hypothetical protein
MNKNCNCTQLLVFSKRTRAPQVRYGVACFPSRVGGTGIRDGLKHHCPQGLVGSNPTPGTSVGGRRHPDGMVHVRPQSVVDSALAASDAGMRDADNAALHGVAIKTIRRWRREYQRRGRPRGQGHTTVPCPRCEGRELNGKAYAELLGWYLGDGHISRGRRAVFNLHIFNDQQYTACNARLIVLMGLVKPGGRPHTRVRPGCVVTTVSWKHWPCLFPQHGQDGSTRGRSRSRTGNATLSRSTRPTSCADCSTPTVHG